MVIDVTYNIIIYVSNISGGSGGDQDTIRKQQIYMYTYLYNNAGDAPNYSQVFRIDTSGNSTDLAVIIFQTKDLRDIETVTDPLTKLRDNWKNI